MSTVGGIEIEELQRSFRGALLLPGEPGYDEARKIWNAMIDKRQAMFVRCAGPADVRSAVNLRYSRDKPRNDT